MFITAMCHGDAYLSACNRYEGRIEYLTGNVVTCSGGACVRPNECIKCNEGYYSSSDGYCRGKAYRRNKAFLLR